MVYQMQLLNPVVAFDPGLVHIEGGRCKCGEFILSCRDTPEGVYSEGRTVVTAVERE